MRATAGWAACSRCLSVTPQTPTAAGAVRTVENSGHCPVPSPSRHASPYPDAAVLKRTGGMTWQNLDKSLNKHWVRTSFLTSFPFSSRLLYAPGQMAAECMGASVLHSGRFKLLARFCIVAPCHSGYLCAPQASGGAFIKSPAPIKEISEFLHRHLHFFTDSTACCSKRVVRRNCSTWSTWHGHVTQGR